MMGWTYGDRNLVDVRTWMCVCGHPADDHHFVYWPLGFTIDECERYGSNETGGMKPTWRAWLFNRVLPPAQWVYDRDENGKAVLPGHSARPTRLRYFVRWFVRGPLYIDHCHGFKEA